MGDQPAFMTPRGVIRCALCRNDDYGLPEGNFRWGEGHLGVRFGDHGNGIRVLLEGEDVTDRAYEVIAGTYGVAYLYDLNSSGQRYRCPTGPPSWDGHNAHATVVRLTGRVDVVRDPRSSQAAS